MGNLTRRKALNLAIAAGIVSTRPSIARAEDEPNAIPKRLRTAYERVRRKRLRRGES